MSTLRLQPPFAPLLPIRVRVESLAATLGLVMGARGARSARAERAPRSHGERDATVTVAGGRIACTPNGVELDLS